METTIVKSIDVGDIVQLISGSINMTVSQIDFRDIKCVWCHEGKFYHDTFAIYTLKKVENAKTT